MSRVACFDELAVLFVDCIGAGKHDPQDLIPSLERLVTPEPGHRLVVEVEIGGSGLRVNVDVAPAGTGWAVVGRWIEVTSACSR